MRMLLQLAHSQIFARPSGLRGTTTILRPLIFSTLQIINVTVLSKRVLPRDNRSDSGYCNEDHTLADHIFPYGVGQDSCKSRHEELYVVSLEWINYLMNEFPIIARLVRLDAYCSRERKGCQLVRRCIRQNLRNV